MFGKVGGALTGAVGALAGSALGPLGGAQITTGGQVFENIAAGATGITYGQVASAGGLMLGGVLFSPWETTGANLWNSLTNGRGAQKQ